MTQMNNDMADGFSTALAPEAITPFPNFTEAGLKQVKQMYAELPPSREALATLFAIDAAQTAPTEQWVTFFIQTASDALIWDERPTGTLLDADAKWLLSRFDDAPSLSVMALLVRTLEEAHRTPIWFATAVRNRAVLFHPKMAPELAPTKKTVPYLRLVA